MQKYIVKYNGNDYSNIGYFFLGEKTKNIIKVENIPFELSKSLKLYEDDKKLTLSYCNSFFTFESGNPKFYNEVKEPFIIFNKDTLRAEGNKFDLDFIKLILNKENSSLLDTCILFISKIIDLNSNVKNHVSSAPAYMMYQNDAIFIRNLFNLISFNLLEYEKIINANNLDFLKKNLVTDDFTINEASKLHEVVGLPKFIVSTINKLHLESYINVIKDLSNVTDGNSLKIIFDFLENGKLIFDAQYMGKENKKLKEEKLNSFFIYLTRILKRKSYKVTDLLNYIIRQSFYFSKEGYFVFPVEELMLLSDYLDICEKYGLKFDKYPSQLRRQHDIVSSNVISLEGNSKEYEKDFEDAIKSYIDVEKNIKTTFKLEDGSIVEKEYAFIVPKKIKDIIQEGNIQHHCVGSYADKIINKTARIVFMRDVENINLPLVTIDIDENYNLFEAKKAFNEDVDKDLMKVIDKWLKEIK